MKEKFYFKKSLGQNFLIDKNIVEKIVSSIDPKHEDLVVEIGPGDGSLTKELIKIDTNVICYEIDKRLESKLKEINSDNLEIRFSDFLKINIREELKYSKYNRLFFIGNLPYYITTAIINKIVEESNPYQIVIMIQKEVAERFMAKPNSKDYGSLSVFLQYNFDIEKVTVVSRNCFIPKPNVDSMVIKLTKNNKYIANNENHFYKLVKDAFKQKRKNLRNNLIDYDLEKISNVLSSFNKDLTYRAEALTIEEFITISNSLN